MKPGSVISRTVSGSHPARWRQASTSTAGPGEMGNADTTGAGFEIPEREDRDVVVRVLGHQMLDQQVDQGRQGSSCRSVSRLTSRSRPVSRSSCRRSTSRRCTSAAWHRLEGDHMFMTCRLGFYTQQQVMLGEQGDVPLRVEECWRWVSGVGVPMLVPPTSLICRSMWMMATLALVSRWSGRSRGRHRRAAGLVGYRSSLRVRG